MGSTSVPTRQARLLPFQIGLEYPLMVRCGIVVSVATFFLLKKKPGLPFYDTVGGWCFQQLSGVLNPGIVEGILAWKVTTLWCILMQFLG